MLFRNTNIEHAARESFCKGENAGGVRHCGSNGNKFGTSFAFLDQCFGECSGETAGFGLGGVVQALDGVVFGGPVPTTLLCEHVNDLWAPGHRCGVAQCFFKKRNVVSVEGTGIANT